MIRKTPKNWERDNDMAPGRPLQTDFDDSEISEGTNQADAPLVEKDESGTPYCVNHHVRMKQMSGGKKGSAVAYFGCPVDGCEEKAKRIKSAKSVIPSEPHLCPRCTGPDGKRPVMQRNARLSSAFYTILECGCCSHKSSPMPRPEFVANHERSRRVHAEENLGAR